MKQIWHLTALTFREGVRDRALFGVMGMALVMFVSTIAIVTMFGYDLMKVTIDMNLSVVAFAGLLLCFFININLISKDIDKKTVYCVLSKPISRAQYIVGKYLGTLSLIIAAIFILAVFGAIMVWLIKSSRPEDYFEAFSWMCYIQAVIYEVLMFIVLNAVMIFFSSFTTSSFLTLIYSLATYVAGQSIEEVIQFFKKTNAMGDTGKQLFWGVMEYIFPNLSAYDIKVLASHGVLMSTGHSLLLACYSLFYTAILLAFAVLIFGRRELQ